MVSSRLIALSAVLAACGANPNRVPPVGEGVLRAPELGLPRVGSFGDQAVDDPQAAGAPTAAEAVFDPLGLFDWATGDDHWQIRFPELRWPAAGQHETGVDPSGLRFGPAPARFDAEFEPVAEASLTIEEFSATSVKGAVSWDDAGAQRELTFDMIPTLRRLEPARVEGRPDDGPVPPAVQFSPADTDITFAVFGSAGTGLPGQHRVAEGLAKVAESRRLKFIVSVGDLLGPDGVQARDDPGWQRYFEQVYDRSRLRMTFFGILGDAEHRGKMDAGFRYSTLSQRWAMPGFCYEHRETLPDGGVVQLAALDTQSIAGNIRNPVNRRARSLMMSMLAEEQPTWRIVLGHAPLYSHGDRADSELQTQLRRVCEPSLMAGHADLYISGADRSLQLLASKQGVLHLGVGGGGGPEVAESVQWQDDTLFAATGGGFAVVQAGTVALEITFYDADGEELYRHVVARR